MRNEFENQQLRLGGEQVSRQAEIARLEQWLEQVDGRLTRLERLLGGLSPFPGNTVREAQLKLQVAQQQLQAAEKQSGEQPLPGTQLTTQQLAVARAQAELELARLACSDTLLAVEIEVADAERRAELEQEKLRQVEQLTARGYGSASEVRLQQLGTDRAEKELQRARLKLETYRRLLAPLPTADTATDPAGGK